MSTQINTKKRWQARGHKYFSFVLCLHCLFYLVYWFAVERFRGDVDLFLADVIGWSISYTTLIMALTGIIGLWSLIRFWVLYKIDQHHALTPSIHDWVFFAVGVILMVGFYLTFWIIFQEKPSQRGVLIHLLSLTRLVIDALLFLFAAIWLRRLILYLRQKHLHAKRRWLWSAGILLVLSILVGLWLIPTIYPPNWAYQGDLPTKPALIAHRGAAMLAPENTLGAAELAADKGALGFETDVRISLDGVSFLMRDETLERTTNIAEVYPERVKDRGSDFTWDELDTLNAGLWFLQKDPYGTIDAGLVSQTQISINQGQKIPTLAQALSLADREGMVVLLNLHTPPDDHPHHQDYFDSLLENLRESRLDSLAWLIVDQEQLNILKDEAPQVTRVAEINSTDLPDANLLADLGYEIVHVDTGISNRDILTYRARGLGVNVHIIDEAWLFSQFWFSGVTSVTTTNVQTFSELARPILNIPYSRFLLFWGLYGIIIAIWLASSQPEPLEQTPQVIETPNLLDFATEDDQELNIFSNSLVPLEDDPETSSGQNVKENEDEEPDS